MRKIIVGDTEGTSRRYYATGKRKSAVARVWLRHGEGLIRINERDFKQYFGRSTLGKLVTQPLQTVDALGKFDIDANVRGGGSSGQAGALRHAVAKALTLVDPNYRLPLKKAGFLTRDPREVERKKYGQPGARKRFQFSKR